MIQGAHVVQPVRQLDHDDSYIFRHGQSHFLKILSLSLCPTLKNVTELTNAIHEMSDVFTKFFANRVLENAGVFYDIV